MLISGVWAGWSERADGQSGGFDEAAQRHHRFSFLTHTHRPQRQRRRSQHLQTLRLSGVDVFCQSSPETEPNREQRHQRPPRQKPSLIWRPSAFYSRLFSQMSSARVRRTTVRKISWSQRIAHTKLFFYISPISCCQDFYKLTSRAGFYVTHSSVHRWFWSSSVAGFLHFVCRLVLWTHLTTPTDIV